MFVLLALMELLAQTPLLHPPLMALIGVIKGKYSCLRCLKTRSLGCEKGGGIKVVAVTEEPTCLMGSLVFWAKRHTGFLRYKFRLFY